MLLGLNVGIFYNLRDTYTHLKNENEKTFVISLAISHFLDTSAFSSSIITALYLSICLTFINDVSSYQSLSHITHQLNGA